MRERKGHAKKALALLLSLLIVFSMMPSMAFAAEADGRDAAQAEEAPKSLTIVCESVAAIDDTTILTKTGDVLQFKALDENGKETPVTWSSASSWVGTLDPDTGVLTTTGSFSCGTSLFLEIKAVSKLDETVKKEARFTLTGWMASTYNKAPTVQLSTDGQTAKTISTSAGYAGKTLWTYETKDGIAALAADQKLADKKNSIKFNALRPGTFTATYTLEDMDPSMTETIHFTITGVAVEDQNNKQAKTYLTKTANTPDPTAKLTAYTMEDRNIVSWESADASIATVDENGTVTGHNVGSVIITATDNEGAKGGIKVVVQDGETPYFENLQFTASAITNYAKDYKFSPTTTEYNLPIRAYSTSSLVLQGTTLFDAEKYTATASYTDAKGQEQNIPVNCGALTTLANIPFDQSVLTITLAEKGNPSNKTVYTFNVNRPRDTTKVIKSNTGIVLSLEGRNLLATKYQGLAEGVMGRADENGNLMTGTGVMGNMYYYHCYALNDVERFSLNLSGSTAYTHLRYSIDDGKTWNMLPQGGGNTEKIDFAPKTEDKNSVVKVKIQVLDDQTYTNHVANGEDGFAGNEATTYTVWVEQVDGDVRTAQILTAEQNVGDWYPVKFIPDIYSYTIMAPNGTSKGEVKYTAAEGATVKVGSTEQIPDENGVYTLSLKTSAQKVTVTSEDGAITNTYSFTLAAKSKMAVPDRVVDYLCINSQYTNGNNGTTPWNSLRGSLTSLGNFGGYITYYYEQPLVDNPNNKYGMDFYVYGNANVDTSSSTKMSFFEPGQVWVSEDGENWYALAGSAHYDNGVDWNYTVTYKKTANGKTTWHDNHGNSNAGASYTGIYPSENIYPSNSQAKEDSITLSGICLPAATGNIAESGVATDAYAVNWGYADVFANGTMGEDVNPYLDNSNHDLKANGFDLAWAVDANGNPIDVSGMEFHYVKVQTASNIWHSAFGDKSTEVSAVVRTTAQAASVGVTNAPTRIVISDGDREKTVELVPGQQTYSVDLDDMKYVSIGLDGCDAGDNIYINNQRIGADQMAEGIKVVKEDGERLVRIIVQNGEKAPVIYLLKLTSSASGDELIDQIKLDVQGNLRNAETADGLTYTAEVGYRIDSVGILPVTGKNVKVTIDGAPVKDRYALKEGENVFTITAEENDVSEVVTLKIKKEATPVTTGQIRVQFTLMGDSAHGEDGQIHTLINGGLEEWISNESVEVEGPATVLDVLEKALAGRYSFNNADGNYISAINGLAEFDNGRLSGWLYTVNGAYPEKGVAEQTVKNGDVIVFHYTDDYTKERASEGFNPPVIGGDDSEIDDPNTPLDPGPEAVTGLVSKMKLTARSARTSKKNVKVTVKMDTASADAVKELKEMGYTVKYRYYRSTKKASGYKSTLTKTTTTYTNTIGKKGQMYYYKVQLRVYDKDGKLVAKTALKQCKYANRLWTKK